MKNRKALLIFGIVTSIISVFIIPLAMVNTGVSIKYETEFGSECISHITGKNLCAIQNTLIGLWILSFAVMTFLLIFRKRVLKLK